LYYFGEGVEQDYSEALKWYRKVAEQGDSFLEVDAQYRLGVMYRRGEGVSANNAKAARWFREAAEQGETRAQYSLGVMYAYGEGVPENDAEAVKWLRRYAEWLETSSTGYDKLFHMYAYGDGLPKDHAEAMKWFRRSAGRTGRYWYDKVQGVPEDDAEAVKWYRRGAENEKITPGSVAFNLGVIYDIGLGVPVDKAEAARWIRKAADDLHTTARLVTGQSGPYDAREGKWLRRGAELGFADAQRRLGFNYSSGEGVPKDYVRAYAWWNIAAAQGDTSAAEIRDVLQSSMTADQIARAQELSATLFNRIYQSR
jgi:hypothetical protein